MPIYSNSESGTYKVDGIDINDTSSNSTYFYSYNDTQNKLSSGQYTVSGTTGADITKPTFDSISVDKIKATAGDSVKVSVKATDDVGIQYLYVHYYTPITHKSF